MFSPDIVESDAFLEMPASAHSLYFHLGMYADDDGFVSPRKIMRLLGSTEDDIKLLVAKNFVLPFENGVIVIKHWKMNNLVRKDWYRPTQYIEQKCQLYVKENGAYTLDSEQGVPLVNEPLTTRQRRLGKVSIGNTSVANAPRVLEITEEPDTDTPSKEKEKDDFVALYNELCEWAKKRRGAGFVSTKKQYAALKKARLSGIGPNKLKERWKELEGKDFYIENGLDWGSVVSNFDKKV
jgi:hypothetical protein